MDEPIKWLEGGGCLIAGRVWISVISPVHTPGKGYAVTPMYFKSVKEYGDALLRRSAPSDSP